VQDYELCGHAYLLLPGAEGDECVNVNSGARNSTVTVPPVEFICPNEPYLIPTERL